MNNIYNKLNPYFLLGSLSIYFHYCTQYTKKKKKSAYSFAHVWPLLIEFFTYHSYEHTNVFSLLVALNSGG